MSPDSPLPTRTRRAWRVLSAFACILAAASITWSAYLFTRLASEGKDRRNQSCRLFEGKHLDDVETLRRTYDRLPEALEFYMKTSPPKLHAFLRNAIAADIVRLERQVRSDSVPAYCDEPGVGLPEPNPVIPKRPDLPRLFKP